MKKHKNNHIEKKDQLIIILSVLLVVSMGVTLWILFSRKKTSAILPPDYALMDEEKNAVPITDDDNSEKMEQQQGGGAVSLTYAKEIFIDLSQNTVNLMFANPAKSNQSMLIWITIQDTVIAKSGLLLPGNQITQLDLEETVTLSAGEYNGKITVYYYQPDSGEKAMINTEIPLTVTVQ